MSQIPFNIKTEAGKALWKKINLENGSAVWGAVGEGIEAIETEVEQRIIKLLEDETLKLEFKEWATDDLISGVHRAIALIKGEQEIHTHEIEVSGAPCIYGTFHEYCNTCDWAEPCDPEGENK